MFNSVADLGEWLVVGTIAGYTIGLLFRGWGFGILGDIVFGLLGAFGGALSHSFRLPVVATDYMGAVVVAFVGAMTLVALLVALTNDGYRTDTGNASHSERVD